MPRILKNIRIDEVSACIKGAGAGTKVMIMKRDDSEDGDIYNSQWYKEQAAEAERQNEEHTRKHDEREERDKHVISAARKRFQENWNKAFADDAADETVSADNDHHASKVADLLVESGKHPDRQAALDHLLHTAQGAAMLRRLSKSEDSTTMTTPQDKLRDLAKRAGPVAIAKVILDDDNGYGISEHEMTELVTAYAKQEKPQISEAQAFVKVFTDPSEAGVTLRKAFNVIKAAAPAEGTTYPFPKF